MGNSRTVIEWTEATWNPASGCTKVSAGCKYCYAERLWPRLSAPGQPYAGRRFTDVKLHPERLAEPRGWRRPRMVFVNSMSDLFHLDIAETYIAEVLRVITETPRHTFQILTKRPERLAAFSPFPPNAWVGVSVENHEEAARRVDLLAETEARVRFLSCEPLLEPLDLRPWLPLLQWVIVGGETGAKARRMEPEWAADVLAQCRAAGVPFFMKQMSRKAPIPPTLMVREFPA